MADAKISALTSLTGANVDTAADVLPIVDTSVTTTKKILVDELGISLNATKAQQETGTDTTSLVSPAVQQYHPSACKAWVLFDGTGAVADSYNVTSVARNSVGNFTVTIATDFSGTTFAMITTALNAAGQAIAVILSRTVGTVVIGVSNLSGTLIDPDGVSLACFGDQ